MSVKTVNQAVMENLKNISEHAFGKAVAILADQEIDKRTKQIVSAMTEADNLHKNLKKIDRPDEFRRDREGKVVPGSESFSEARIKEIKKATDRLQKIDKALEEAFENANFELLNNLGDNKSNNNEEGK